MKIYEPAGRAREYSPLALNHFKGCEHGCLYCYVTHMMVRFNSKYVHSNVNSEPNYKEIESSAQKFRDCNKQILSKLN
jgi:DNA repair photolyase